MKLKIVLLIGVSFIVLTLLYAVNSQEPKLEFVTKDADIGEVKKGGLLIINSSQIDVQPKVDDSVEVVKIPIDEIAVGLGNAKVANMVALGAYLQKRGLFSPEEAAESLPDVLAERYHVIIPLNKKALQKGAQFVKESVG